MLLVSFLYRIKFYKPGALISSLTNDLPLSLLFLSRIYFSKSLLRCRIIKISSGSSPEFTCILKNLLQKPEAFKTQRSVAIMTEWPALGWGRRWSDLSVLSAHHWSFYCEGSSGTHRSKNWQMKRDLHCACSWRVKERVQRIKDFKKTVPWLDIFMRLSSV